MGPYRGRTRGTRKCPPTRVHLVVSPDGVEWTLDGGGRSRTLCRVSRW